VLEDKALVEASLNSIYLRASFLAASTHHSVDWLFAMPIASCGLRLDDEARRVAEGLRLGLTSVCHIIATAVTSSMPIGYTVLFVKELRAGQQGTML